MPKRRSTKNFKKRSKKYNRKNSKKNSRKKILRRSIKKYGGANTYDEEFCEKMRKKYDNLIPDNIFELFIRIKSPDSDLKDLKNALEPIDDFPYENIKPIIPVLTKEFRKTEIDDSDLKIVDLFLEKNGIENWVDRYKIITEIVYISRCAKQKRYEYEYINIESPYKKMLLKEER